LNFLGSPISLAALIQVSRLMINKHLGGLPTGTSYWTNYVLSSVKVSGFTEKHWAAKLLSTWQL